MSGLSGPTVDRIMNGIGQPKVETVDKIAHALGIPVERAREAAGKPRGTARPYTPPAEANLLDERQRRAIDELIRAFVHTEGHTDDTDTSPQPQPRTETSSPIDRGAGRTPRERPITAAGTEDRDEAEPYRVSGRLYLPEHQAQFEQLSPEDQALVIAAIDRLFHGLPPQGTLTLAERGLLELALTAQLNKQHGGPIEITPFPAGTTYRDVHELRDRGVAAALIATGQVAPGDMPTYTRVQGPDVVVGPASDPTAPPPLHLADAARTGESEAERRRREDGGE